MYRCGLVTSQLSLPVSELCLFPQDNLVCGRQISSNVSLAWRCHLVEMMPDDLLSEWAEVVKMASLLRY